MLKIITKLRGKFDVDGPLVAVCQFYPRGKLDGIECDRLVSDSSTVTPWIRGDGQTTVSNKSESVWAPPARVFGKLEPLNAAACALAVQESMPSVGHINRCRWRTGSPETRSRHW